MQDGEGKDDDNEVVTYLEDEEEKSAIFESRIETAKLRKAEGNEFYNTQDFDAALKKYRYGLYHCFFDEMSFNFELMEEHRQIVTEIRLPLLLNCLQCFLQDYNSEQHELALHCASDALKLDPTNSKALYRRAQLYLREDKIDKAKADLVSAAKSDPQSVAVRKLLSETVSKLQSIRKEADKEWKKKLSQTFKSTVTAEETNSPSTSNQMSFCRRIIQMVFGEKAKSD